ncbi:hypothetical protein CRG98_033773 [Punica granatum]|uniref:Uncharacterized protein n=1 Tax=Punica granatum TaxID=22663 RepID=A0A2I0IQR2_PUNGR|nr:hypothetical protein CRG98_033773 [Punica granatum]
METEQAEKPEETTASPAIGAGPRIAQYSEVLLGNSTALSVESSDVFFSKWEEDLVMIDFSNDIWPKILTTEEEIFVWSSNWKGCLDHYLTICEWTPDFDPWASEVERTTIWPAVRGDNGGKKDVMGAQKGRSEFAFAILEEIEVEIILEEVMLVGSRIQAVKVGSLAEKPTGDQTLKGPSISKAMKALVPESITILKRPDTAPTRTSIQVLTSTRVEVAPTIPGGVTHEDKGPPEVVLASLVKETDNFELSNMETSSELFSWNCRGAGSINFLGSLRYYLRLHSPDIVAIVEPRISNARADKVCRKFREFEVVRVEAEGFSGGVWVFWRLDCIRLTILQRHKQAIHVRVEEGSCSWLFTAVYGSPNAIIREDL